MKRPTSTGRTATSADHFDDQLRLLAALEPNAATDRVLDAFRNVPREAFAGPGPWLVRSPLGFLGLPPQRTPDDDPRWLYHDVLVVLDEAKGINIGEPALWARLLARVDVMPDARVLQVGAGVGYYTAVLRQLAGSGGSMLAYEVEAELAERAAANLADSNDVIVRHGNAATELDEDGRFDLVVAFAGVTHVPRAWSERLAPDARLLLPLTGRNGWGAMMLARPDADGFRAETVGLCGFHPCAGARNDALAEQVDDLFSDSKRLDGWHFRITGTAEEVSFEEDAP